MSKMDWMDAEELAAKVCGLPDDYDSDGVETAIYEKFDCSFETFHKIAESLMKFTLPAKSALTDKVYRGFVDGDFFICKEEVE
jgi:hypothetical protein